MSLRRTGDKVGTAQPQEIGQPLENKDDYDRRSCRTVLCGSILIPVPSQRHPWVRQAGILVRKLAWVCGTIVVVLVLLWCLRWRALAEPDDLCSNFSSFTVALNTFQRPEYLKLAIEHYATCDGVDSVRVVWSEQTPPPDPRSAPHLFNHRRPVLFHTHGNTSLNNRFYPLPDLKTEAVFVVDDDVDVPCPHLCAAYQTWERHRDALVGFYPRSHVHYTGEGVHKDSGDWEYLYFWRVLFKRNYSMVLTKAAFLHAKYLNLYSGVDDVNGGGNGDFDVVRFNVGMAMQEARAYVDSNRNCEDIAMQMVVTAASGLPPVTTFAPLHDHGLLSGISTGEGSGKWWRAPHAVKRSKCLADLNEIFCKYAVAGLRPLPRSPEIAPIEEYCSVLKHTELFAVSRSAITNDEGSDLSYLSVWGLALRVPTVAEFISVDMVLIPGKLWQGLVRFLGLVPV
ncbi:unnamed protein product [Choristocarpus tenellus]